MHLKWSQAKQQLILMLLEVPAYLEEQSGSFMKDSCHDNPWHYEHGHLSETWWTRGLRRRGLHDRQHKSYSKLSRNNNLISCKSEEVMWMWRLVITNIYNQIPQLILQWLQPGNRDTHHFLSGGILQSLLEFFFHWLGTIHQRQVADTSSVVLAIIETSWGHPLVTCLGDFTQWPSKA